MLLRALQIIKYYHYHYYYYYYLMIIIISVKQTPALQAKDGSTLLLAKVQVNKRHSEGHIQ